MLMMQWCLPSSRLSFGFKGTCWETFTELEGNFHKSIFLSGCMHVHYQSCHFRFVIKFCLSQIYGSVALLENPTEPF